MVGAGLPNYSTGGVIVNKQLRDEWVAALRSGKYKQTTGALFRGEACCCLGVLCRVAGVESLAVPAMTDIWERRPYKRIGYDLVGMNDNERRSFAEIADWIEANLPVTP